MSSSGGMKSHIFIHCAVAVLICCASTGLTVGVAGAGDDAGTEPAAGVVGAPGVGLPLAAAAGGVAVGAGEFGGLGPVPAEEFGGRGPVVGLTELKFGVVGFTELKFGVAGVRDCML
jgi:hypothetical protein